MVVVVMMVVVVVVVMMMMMMIHGTLQWSHMQRKVNQLTVEKVKMM